MWLDFRSHAWYVFAMAPISFGAPSPRACVQADSDDFTPGDGGRHVSRSPAPKHGTAFIGKTPLDTSHTGPVHHIC
jgi:hypothetical protein